MPKKRKPSKYSDSFSGYSENELAPESHLKKKMAVAAGGVVVAGGVIAALEFFASEKMQWLNDYFFYENALLVLFLALLAHSLWNIIKKSEPKFHEDEKAETSACLSDVICNKNSGSNFLKLLAWGAIAVVATFEVTNPVCSTEDWFELMKQNGPLVLGFSLLLVIKHGVDSYLEKKFQLELGKKLETLEQNEQEFPNNNFPKNPYGDTFDQSSSEPKMKPPSFNKAFGEEAIWIASTGLFLIAARVWHDPQQMLQMFENPLACVGIGAIAVAFILSLYPKLKSPVIVEETSVYAEWGTGRK